VHPQFLIAELRPVHSILLKQDAGRQRSKSIAIFVRAGRRDTQRQVPGSSAVAKHAFLDRR
jgi:hypothetical protein